MDRVKLNELHERRNKIVSDQRELLDQCEGRNLNAFETEKYERLDADFEKLTNQIDGLRNNLTRAGELRNRLEERQEYLNKSKLRDELKSQVDNGHIEHRQNIKTPNRRVMSREVRQGYENVIVPFMRGEQRGIQADQDTLGGYTVLPKVIYNEVINDINNQVFLRDLSRIFVIDSADSQGIPLLESDISSPAWKSELAEADLDTSMRFSKITLTPHRLCKAIKVSRQLMRSATPTIAAYVISRLQYQLSITLENCYQNGMGAAGEPLGVFVASNSGIGTGRDVSEGNITTGIKADGLINCMYSCKEAYIKNGVWIFHRDAVKQIRKLKDGEGSYIWNAGIAGDRPASILDRPYYMSEYAPHTFTTGLYAGIFGDFSYYGICDSGTIELQRLVEKYALENQDCFLINFYSSGNPLLEEAFARVKLA